MTREGLRHPFGALTGQATNFVKAQEKIEGESRFNLVYPTGMPTCLKKLIVPWHA